MHKSKQHCTNISGVGKWGGGGGGGAGKKTAAIRMHNTLGINPGPPLDIITYSSTITWTHYDYYTIVQYA